MTYFDDAVALVNHVKDDLTKLVQSYDSSLQQRTIERGLLVDIKNLMENLRSALDYSAHGLFSKYGSSTKPDPKIYFPYAALTQTQAAFQASKRIEACIPGLTASRPDIVVRLESYQHYASPTNKWLPLFMELNNENKHEKLTPQTAREARALRVESKGAVLDLGPGASANIGQGASIQVGDAVIPGSQNISGDSTARIHGTGRQAITVWVSFIFDSNGEEALPFLRNAVGKVEEIVRELSAL